MIEVHASPLGRIYAGKPVKNGMWGKNKYDVTDMAVCAAATVLIKTDQTFCFQYNNKTYEMKIVEVNESEKKS